MIVQIISLITVCFGFFLNVDIDKSDGFLGKRKKQLRSREAKIGLQKQCVGSLNLILMHLLITYHVLLFVIFLVSDAFL